MERFKSTMRVSLLVILIANFYYSQGLAQVYLRTPNFLYQDIIRAEILKQHHHGANSFVVYQTELRHLRLNQTSPVKASKLVTFIVSDAKNTVSIFLDSTIFTHCNLSYNPFNYPHKNNLGAIKS